jgi:hypothetical protein
LAAMRWLSIMRIAAKAPCWRGPLSLNVRPCPREPMHCAERTEFAVHGWREPSVLRQPVHGVRTVKRFASTVGVGCPSFGGQRAVVRDQAGRGIGWRAVEAWRRAAQPKFQRGPQCLRSSKSSTLAFMHESSRVHVGGWASFFFCGARPNPSIERTCSSGLRPLPHAAHVKR